jgi:predicted nucleic acid-binding protein
MKTIPDSNIILDVLQEDPAWFTWSANQLKISRDMGELVVNFIVYAEASARHGDHGEFQKGLARFGVEREDVPWLAAFEAGRAHLAYRRAGGLRDRLLPDFIIGAHAAISGHRLVTRDGHRFRGYFPTLQVIAPDTHP